MASSYPAGLDTLSTSRVTGDTIVAQTDNDQADAINKIERAIGAPVVNGRLKVVQEAPVNAKWPQFGTLLGDDSVGSHTANNAALGAAIDLAAAAVHGGGEVYVAGGVYRYMNLAKTVDDVTIKGDGPGKTILKTMRTHAADQSQAIRLQGDNLTVRDLELREGNPIALRTGRNSAWLEDGEMLRIGGTFTPAWKERAHVENVWIDGGYTGALNIYFVDRAYVKNVRIKNAFGDGMNFENCREDIHADNIVIQDTTDDLFIIKTDLTVPGGTKRAVVNNLILREGDTKGFATAGVKYLEATNIVVDRTWAPGVAVFKDPGYPNLQPSHEVHLENVHVIDAGKYFGADTAQYLHAAASSVPYGLHVENAHGVKTRNFTIENAHGRAYSVDGICSDLDIDVDVRGAGGAAGNIGNPDGSSYTDISDFRVRHRSRNTVGGLVVGGCRRGVIEQPQARSYDSGAAGEFRGLQIGKAQDVNVTSPMIVNDDGATGATVFVYNGPDHVRIERGIQKNGSTYQWEGSTSWSIPTTADGAVATTTVTCPGAIAGDQVECAYAANMAAGAVFAAAVTADDTVTVTLLNKTGTPLSTGPNTLRVWIRERVY